MPLVKPDLPATSFSWKKFLSRLALGIGLLALVLFIWSKSSPLPATMLYRFVFDKGGEKANAALAQFLPRGLTERLDLEYAPGDKDGRLDLFYPAAMSGQRLPLIIWVHGGGLISGSKEQVRNYCKILAGKGFAVAAIDYSVAPGKQYPTPVRQANEALAYLLQQSGQFPIDTSKIFLAGDSGGSHIIAQLAAGISNPGYSTLLGFTPAVQRGGIKGMILFCGPYDIRNAVTSGVAGHFMTTVLWAYSGRKDFQQDAYFQSSNVLDYLDAGFPPSFISAGNGDFLLPHSEALSKKLASLQVPIDTLFFPRDFQPPLPHEYQFNLGQEPAREALDRVVRFIHKTSAGMAVNP
jgi:acetyl esterase/lipase